jgi:hypothetical protein
VEFQVDKADELPGLEAGDAVLWNGELFRLDAIKEDEQGTWGVIINVHGEEEVYIDALTFVAKDTLTGVGGGKLFEDFKKKDKKVVEAKPSKYFSRYDQKYSENDGYTYGGQEWCTPPKTSSSSSYSNWREDDDWRPKNKWDKPWSQKKPAKKDSISTASLIQDEVRTLNENDSADSNNTSSNNDGSYSPPSGSVRPLRTKPPSTSKNDSDTPPKPLIKRKGDW